VARIGRGRPTRAGLWKDQFLEFRYEQLLANPMSVWAAFALLGVDATDAAVRPCVEANKFETRTGRERGQSDPTSVMRKGVAGDWIAYFSDQDKTLYKEACGQLLVELGYAPNNAW
jgi:hypothetical protein